MRFFSPLLKSFFLLFSSLWDLFTHLRDESINYDMEIYLNYKLSCLYYELYEF